jgi:ABC-type nitrate/sulfonate/bicarbonate transport system substrate-binding protein
MEREDMFCRLVLILTVIGGSLASAAAGTPTSVVVGWGAYPDVPQLAEAADKNLWKEQGLVVQTVAFPTGREMLEALLGGQIDFAVMTEFPAVVAMMRSAKFAIPAVLSSYASIRIVTKAPDGAKTLKQLAGRKVGTPLGTNMHFLLAEALRKEGLSVALVNASSTDLLPALERGDIDAAMPFPSAYGGMKRTLGGAYQEIPLTGRKEFFVLLASDKLATRNPDLIRRFLAVLLVGEELLTKDPHDGQAATARYVGKAMTFDSVVEAWPDYRFRIELDRPVLDLMVYEGGWLKTSGYVKDGTPSFELFRSYMMDGPLRALAPDRVTLP